MMQPHPRARQPLLLAGPTIFLLACAHPQSGSPPAAASQPMVQSPDAAQPVRVDPVASALPAGTPGPAVAVGPAAVTVAATPEVFASGPGWSIITTAPDGLTAADLGRMFDAAFQPLAGSGALWRAKASESYPVFRHSVALVEDRVNLAATVRSWGLNADACRNRRFASYRAEQITDVHAVDDTTPPKGVPAMATYYLAKVFYGRSFEVRLSGEEKQFHSGLAGTFLSGKLDGGLKSFAEKNRLEFTAVGRGLRPKTGTAIFAKQPWEIEENYTVEGSVAVPVAVEYRLIPGRELPKVEPIAWRKLARYRLELSAVEAHGCDKTSACDLSVTVAQVEGAGKGKTYRGPDDVDLWEPRYLLLETTEEADLMHGFDVEVADRNFTGSHLLGRCQVRMDQVRLKVVNEAPDRRVRWTELCGKSQVRLTLISEDAS